MDHVLITGASTGIGYASVKYLLEQGYFVFGSVRSEEDAKRLEAEFGTFFQALCFDVTDEAAVHRAKEQLVAQLGGRGLAGLVNNAGIAIAGPLAHIPMEQIKWQFDVNVIGLIQVTKAFLPLLGTDKSLSEKPGRIINISSVSGINTTPIAGLYSASKFAVESLSDALRRELFIYDIDVIVLQPGPIKTPIWEKTKAGKDDYADTDYAAIMAGLAKRLAESEAKAMETEAVAKRVHDALRLRKPKTRYIIARNGWILPLVAKFLPDRVVDRIIFRTLAKYQKMS